MYTGTISRPHYIKAYWVCRASYSVKWRTFICLMVLIYNLNVKSIKELSVWSRVMFRTIMSISNILIPLLGSIHLLGHARIIICAKSLCYFQKISVFMRREMCKLYILESGICFRIPIRRLLRVSEVKKTRTK